MSNNNRERKRPTLSIKVPLALPTRASWSKTLLPVRTITHNIKIKQVSITTAETESLSRSRTVPHTPGYDFSFVPYHLDEVMQRKRFDIMINVHNLA